MKRSFALVAVAAVALVAAASATAHAEISPPVALANAGQLFTLDVPTEKEGATTTTIVLTVPSGFSIDSFVDAPGWKRDVSSTGSGEDAVIQSVTWSGGRVPTGDVSHFAFLGRTDASKSYAFSVEQSYSDGSVVNWSGAESSDAPAPVVQAVSSFGGDGSSTLGIVAVAVGAVALLLAVGGLLARGGRPLT
jgi:uncharacterized protein YcnI